MKYLYLFWKHWKIRNKYDFLIVGYPGHVVVPFAKLISKKPVILDALCSLYEGVIISREKNGLFFLREKYTRLVDRLAIKFADAILVETNLQKQFFEERLGAPPGKCFRVFTGADDSVFYPDDNIKKNKDFTVVFRGKFLPEAGVTYVVKAAKILETTGIQFLIIGNGFLQKEVIATIEDIKPKNLKLISDHLEFGELRQKMLECHVSLGQFASHKRLYRTIPHKCFESLALGLPYITAESAGVGELLTDGINCLMVKEASPEAISEAIIQLKKEPELALRLSKAGVELYKQKLTPYHLAKQILDIMQII